MIGRNNLITRVSPRTEINRCAPGPAFGVQQKPSRSRKGLVGIAKEQISKTVHPLTFCDLSQEAFVAAN